MDEPLIAPKTSGAVAEREKTNESLREEREKADHAVIARQEATGRADAVVDRARDKADTVLTVAREKADAVLEVARDKAEQLIGPAARSSEPQVAVVEERVLADEVLQDAHDTADEVLRAERAEYDRVRKKFLPLERESTDRYLQSERIRSDDALANRDDFLAIVTHDLRDLIGGIVMSAAVLSKTAAKDEQGRRTLTETGRIERYAARMNRLIGDLVDVASIDAGKLAVAPAAGDAAGLVAEAVETFQESAAARKVGVKARVAGAPLAATFDHDRILQVLANLISNSLKFTSPGGEIVVSGERVDGNIRLAVADTGSGIPAGALESVFERFSQADKNDRRGLGLGLYISRCIVEAHGGKIWAESVAAGSRVCFTLPAALKA